MRMQRTKKLIHQAKKDNSILKKKLRSAKMKNLYNNNRKRMPGFDERNIKSSKHSKKNSENTLQGYIKHLQTLDFNQITGHKKLLSKSTRNMNKVGIFLFKNQKNQNQGFISSRKSYNEPIKHIQGKEKKKHIRAKSDIPLLTQLMRENKGRLGSSLGGGLLAKLFEKKGGKATPRSKTVSGNKKRDWGLKHSHLNINIKILNEHAKTGDAACAQKLEKHMKKEHKRKWKGKPKRKKERKFNSTTIITPRLEKNRIMSSVLDSEKTTREESFMNNNHHSLKKLRQGLRKADLSTRQKIQEEYALDFRQSSQKKSTGERIVTEFMPSMKTGISLGEKVVRMKKVLSHHLDSVRALEFFDDSLLLTSSDDYTVCLWDTANSAVSKNKTISPSYVSRVDQYSILAMQRNTSKYSEKSSIFSSNSNGEIRLWTYFSSFKNNKTLKLVPSNVIAKTSDSIWDMSTTPKNNLLLTSSPSGISVWDISDFSSTTSEDYFYNQVMRYSTRDRAKPINLNKLPNTIAYRDKPRPSYDAQQRNLKINCIQEFKYDPNSFFYFKKGNNGKYGRFGTFSERKKVYDTPTSLTWIDQHIFASAFSLSNHIALFDVEKSKKLLSMKSNQSSKLRSFSSQGILTQPNKIILVNENLLFAGYENKIVACFDRRTGKSVHEFIAHSDSVTSLDYSPHSSILFTSSHDGCLRSWDMKTYRCINDLNIHRKKYDESILSIRLNPKKSHLASGGADSFVKLFSILK